MVGLDATDSPDLPEDKLCGFEVMLKWQIHGSPLIIFPTIVIMESLRTIPGEIRMYSRMAQRGRPNVPEILFLSLKYLALVTVVADLLLEFGKDW